MSLPDALKTALVGKQESCEACGASFECGRMLGATCWCAGEKVPTETLDNLKKCYSRCLCPQCLRAAAGQPPPSS